jgi:hypothetical protein
MPAERRYAILEITAAILPQLLKPTPSGVAYRVDQNAIPEDAEVMAVDYDQILQVWRIALTSESFAPVPPGVTGPTLDSPTVTTVLIQELAGV